MLVIVRNAPQSLRFVLLSIWYLAPAAPRSVTLKVLPLIEEEAMSEDAMAEAGSTTKVIVSPLALKS